MRECLQRPRLACCRPVVPAAVTPVQQIGGEEVEVAERPLGQHLGSGRIVASDVEVPIMLVNLV